MSGRIFIFFIFIFTMSSGQESYIDSLKNSLKKAQQDSTRCKLLVLLADQTLDNESYKFNDELLKLVERNLQRKNLNRYEQRFYRSHFATCLYNQGFLAQQQGNIAGALALHEKSLKIRETLNDTQGIAVSLNIIGGIYKNQGDTVKALEFYKKSLKIFQEMGDLVRIGDVLNNIGTIYFNQNDFKKALDFMMESLRLYEQVDDKFGISSTLHNIGSIYFKKGVLDSAIVYYSRSLLFREKIGDKQGISFSLNSISAIYIKQKDYSKAKQYADKSMQIALELGYPNNILKASKSLSEISKATGNYKQALENFELYIQMRDSINNEETKKASIKSQLKYEYEKKAAADSVKVAEEKKVVKAQLKQEKTQRYSLYGGLALVLIFALFMVNRFRVTNKQKKLIEEQKVLVENQKHIVEEKQKEILDSIKYARRIQTALITNEHYIHQNLKRLKR